MRSTLSLLGLYNYNNTILDGLTLPSNFEDGDLDTLKTNLLMETAELELIYTNFDFLKYAITEWSAKQQLEWEELRKTQLYDYNPIWNADYKISDRTDEESGEGASLRGGRLSQRQNQGTVFDEIIGAMGCPPLSIEAYPFRLARSRGFETSARRSDPSARKRRFTWGCKHPHSPYRSEL